MEDRKATILTLLLVVVLIVLNVVAAFHLGPTWDFYIVFGVSISIIFGLFGWLMCKRVKPKPDAVPAISRGQSMVVDCSFLRKVAGVPTRFRYKEIEHATDNFNALVGRGASGCVFKGILNDGTCVAVKRIEGQERAEREFRSEVAAIASVQHINLVHLYGYCMVADGPRFLVYEFIQNGSLDGWIFPKRHRRNCPGGCLPWRLRCRVATDVAKALSYLHHDCRSRILHLDVKPENILLDDTYRAVVSDFGLAKLMGRDESRIVTTVRGTKGYLAPEWLLENGVTAKSDVYSFGMVLLEMIGGRRNVCMISNDHNDKSVKKWDYFPKIVVERLRQGKIMEVVDQRLLLDGEGQVSEDEVRKLVYIALWCIQEKPRRRPTMAQVVEMLEGHLDPCTRLHRIRKDVHIVVTIADLVENLQIFCRSG